MALTGVTGVLVRRHGRGHVVTAQRLRNSQVASGRQLREAGAFRGTVAPVTVTPGAWLRRLAPCVLVALSSPVCGDVSPRMLGATGAVPPKDTPWEPGWQPWRPVCIPDGTYAQAGRCHGCHTQATSVQHCVPITQPWFGGPRWPSSRFVWSQGCPHCPQGREPTGQQRARSTACSYWEGMSPLG